MSEMQAFVCVEGIWWGPGNRPSPMYCICPSHISGVSLIQKASASLALQNSLSVFFTVTWQCESFSGLHEIANEQTNTAVSSLEKDRAPVSHQGLPQTVEMWEAGSQTQNCVIAKSYEGREPPEAPQYKSNTYLIYAIQLFFWKI